jgi:NifU-like protein
VNALWEYTDQVMDHFRQPRNIGRIEDPDGDGMVGSIACGDALRLQFKLDGQGKIAEAKFQTFGCGSAIASASVLTEMLKGLSLEEAERISNQDIADRLGGLPAQKMHCSVLGRDALEAAIASCRGESPVDKEHEEERVVCVCFGVTEQAIERAIRENGLTTAEQVSNYTKAGGGCGGCLDEIEGIIRRVTQAPGGAPEGTPAPRPKLTNIQKIRLIEETIDREIRPQLRLDGGDIELLDVDGGQVIVSLRGACANCPVSRFTLSETVQAKLREFVSDDLVVVEGTVDDGVPG